MLIQNGIDDPGWPAKKTNHQPFAFPAGKWLLGRLRRRRYRGLQSPVLAGTILVSSALLIFITASAAQFTVRRMQASFEWVKHTQRVLIEVGQLQTNIFAALATQRSYLLTKRPNRLDDLQQIAAELYAQLDDVGDLIQDNPPQQQRLALVRGLIEQWLTRLRAELEKAAVGSAEASEIDDLARDGRSSIGKVVQQLVNAEVALLDTREDQATRVAAIASYLGISTLVLGLVTAGLGVWLIQSQRVETRIRDMQATFTENARDTVIGETAVIVAHEVIQPLAATKNYLAAARRMMGRDATQASAQVNALDQAITQVDRATEVLRHLRSFGGQAGLGRSVVSIARVIADTIAVAGLDWNGATIIQEIAPGLPNSLINRVHIQQVLVNLMRNGLEAMAHSNRRELVMAAALADPAMIRVSVRDSGPGLPPEVLEKLFRPFVTTKEGGMGVGLSICRRIVEAHGGQISARNLEHGGAIFEFTLPVDVST